MNERFNTFFGRHINLLGKEGLRKLRKSTILVAGIGGLGTVVSELLVRLGIGKLIIIDNGIIDEPDLNRQFFYNYKDIGKCKVDVASKRLKSIFPPDVSPKIISFKEEISKSFLNSIIKDYSIQGVADCVDNFKTKFILDNFCKENDIFFVHAGVDKFFGQILCTNKELKSIYKNLDSKTVFQRDIFPPICFIIGSLVVSEIIKFITNKGILNFDKILTIDIFFNAFDNILLK